MRGLSLHRVGWRHALWSPPRRCYSTRKQASPTDDGVPLERLTPKWQALWEKPASNTHTAQDADKKRAYILPMFPYPSGTLHLGHLRVYTISDVLARFKHMQGYDVLHPIGWDAFGLPAENAAIERGVHPAEWTQQNIETMKTQMMEMGGRWSWDKEIQTCDPDFYKHTQRLFLMLFERGLAYQAESLVNWDPVDQTVLANEQVDANGYSWRSGAKVEQKMLKQWFLKIKDFQEPLLRDMDTLSKNESWPDRVLAMQKNWLGRSVGTKLWFDIEVADQGTNLGQNSTREGQQLRQFDPVEVFTTRADTLFGVKFVCLSLNHPIVQTLAEQHPSLQDFLKRAKSFPADSKEGWLLQGVRARNPIADLVSDNNIQQSVPVLVAPYVLDDYGSGAVMGVPAHDARDHAFWRHNFNGRPLRHVITLEPSSAAAIGSETDKPILEKGFVASSDWDFKDVPSDQAIEKVVERLQQASRPVERTENWRLRDWLISRQRYWGTPIPIVHCGSCGPVPEPEQNLPVKLPDLPASFFQGKPGNPLAKDEDWKETTCPKCCGPAERETDTMDTFMCSSWYFFRFLDPKNENLLIEPQKADAGMPVDVYVGGVEHAILHLLYARFISKFLATTPVWPNGNKVLGEPFKKLITQGMVHGETFSDPVTGRFLRPEELDLSKPSRPLIKGTTTAPKVSYEKMSKSKYNGVDPGATIAKYGADATRAHMLFQAPVSDVLEWDEKKITGVQRWLVRVLKLSSAFWFPAQDLPRLKPPVNLDMDVTTLLKELRDSKVLNKASFDNNASSPYRTEAEELVASLKPAEMELLSKVQEIIVSVTQSYSETYSLNTVVSDLMTLTNTIWDTPHETGSTPWFKWIAIVHLFRMVAPIAPGVAEEGWHALLDRTNHHVRTDTQHPLRDIRGDSGPSIFDFGFPAADRDIIPLLNPTMKCVVQIDGKTRFPADIKKVPTAVLNAFNNGDTIQLIDFLTSELLKTEAGQKYLGKDGGAIWKANPEQEPHAQYKDLPRGWTVVVVKNGRILNLISPKSERKERAAEKKLA